MPLLLGFLLMAGSAIAQGQQMPQNSTQADSITDEELKKFASVSAESQKIQQEMRKKVDSMLTEEDMEMQRFQQIMMSKQNPKMADSVQVTDEEKKKMKKIQPKLMKANRQAQQKMVGVIKDNGLQPQRFQQIMQAVRSNPEVMKRFRKISKESQMNQ